MTSLVGKPERGRAHHIAGALQGGRSLRGLFEPDKAAADAARSRAKTNRFKPPPALAQPMPQPKKRSPTIRAGPAGRPGARR